MDKLHHYEISILWTGNLGAGTATPRAYSRDHEVSADGPGTLAGTSDPAFRGDPARWNPEQLLVASVAQCHMLWYLGLAAAAKVTVTAYEDHPTGSMAVAENGSGQFTGITLRPQVTITADSDADAARALHGRVGDYCFIARSVNFPIQHEETILQELGDTTTDT